MAISDGNTVVMTSAIGGGRIVPLLPIRGTASGVVAGVSADVNWENGFQGTTVPIGSLFKLVDPPAGTLDLIPLATTYRGRTQELTGVISDIFVAEEDGGAQRGFVVLALTGRGESGPSAYLFVETGDSEGGGTAQELFGNFPFTALPAARFPRY